MNNDLEKYIKEYEIPKDAVLVETPKDIETVIYFSDIDNNKIHGDIITANTIKIDDSKFPFLPATIEGDEWEETDLENGVLICLSK